MVAARPTLCLAVFVAACRVAANAAPDVGTASQTTATSVSRDAGLHWAAIEENVAVALPPGLSYCPLPDDRNGVDRGQIFFLVPTSECDWGAFSRNDAWPIPFITIYAVSNILALEELGGDGEAASALDLARAACARAQEFSDIVILGRHGVGCRTDHGDTSTVRLFALADVLPAGASYPPTVTLTLKTTRTRFASDWAVLASIAAGVYICDHPGSRRARTVACPPDGPW
jgi:hypothetical protein